MTRRRHSSFGLWMLARNGWAVLLAAVAVGAVANDQPPPQSPQQSLDAIQLREGCEIELMAAEPLVMDPIALDWGSDGRLWVVEMADYPLGIDDRGAPGGRIRFLTDSDGDGRYDHSQVFLDQIPFPTGVMEWRDGILISAAPHVLFARDTDGDDVADSVEPLFSGFGEGNQQHRFNGFAWGLDNWVYLANGDSGGEIRSVKNGKTVDIRGRDLRIQPDTGELDAQTGQTQFGRRRDDHGNWFGCSNLIPVRHYVLDDHYLRRNPLWVAPSLSRDIAGSYNTQVFPVSSILSHWSDYVPPLPGQPHRFTSASGVCVYRDDRLGSDVQGNTFTCDAVMNVVHRRTLTPDGVSFISRRPKGEEQREFLASTDPWFRPTTVTTGPDGGLWITDMYRLVIEHPEWIDDRLQQQLFLRAGHDRGRIYRVRASQSELRKIPDWTKRSLEQWIDALASPNGRQRDTAHRLLVHRGDERSVGPLRHVVEEHANPMARLHALCVLDGTAGVDLDTFSSALVDEHPSVRRHAVRIAEQVAGDQRDDLLPLLLPLIDDPDPQVRLQLACSLGNWSAPEAVDGLATLAVGATDGSYLRSAVFSSLTAGSLAQFYDRIEHHPETTSGLRLAVIEMAGRGQPPLAMGILETLLAENQQAGIDDARLRAVTMLLSYHSSGAGRWSQSITSELEALASEQFTVLMESPSLDRRVAALRFLAHLPARLSQKYRSSLAGLIDVGQPIEVQQAAARLMESWSEPEDIDSLLQRFSALSPAVRSIVLDQLLARAELSHRLVAALSSGELDPAWLGVTQRDQLLRHGDPKIRAAAIDLLTAPQRVDREQLIETYRSQLTVGDRRKGKQIFAQRCGNCHRLEGVGHAVGPDLNSVVNRTADAMLTAILDPNRAVEDKYRSYRILTVGGRVETGMIAEESSAGLVLVKPDGGPVTMLRSEIETIQDTGVSLMPEGLEQEISATEMSDLLAYLVDLEAPSLSFSGNRPATVTAAEDGSIMMTAGSARIYGSGIEFENRYGNVGYWRDPQARVQWTLEVPVAGRYSVTLDYACAGETAGNHFRFAIGDQAIDGQVHSTGSWDYYRQRQIGHVELAAGRTQATFQASGPIDGYLIDLRSIVLRPVDQR